MTRARVPSEERRRQVAEAALGVLSEQGAARLTAAEIARRVGVSDAALFRHFGTMDEIIAAGVAVVEELLAGDTAETGGDPLERLGRFFVRRVEKVRARPEILRLAFSDRLEEVAGPQGARKMRRIVARSLAFVHACLAEAAAAGQLSSEVPTDVIAQMVVGALRACALERDPAQARPPEQQWAAVERLLRATGRRSASGPATRRGGARR